MKVEENEKMRAFAALLSNEGRSLGLIGPGERERLWERHVENCAALAPFLSEFGARSVVDVGSGGGLPGIVLSILLPRVRFCLLEPRLVRHEWLQRVKRELRLKNVETFKMKAERWRGPLFDAAVCRALAPLPKLVPLLSPLLKKDGKAFVLKGRGAKAEMEGVTGASLFSVPQGGGRSTSVVSFAPWGGSNGKV